MEILWFSVVARFLDASCKILHIDASQLVSCYILCTCVLYVDHTSCLLIVYSMINIVPANTLSVHVRMYVLMTMAVSVVM